MYILTITDCFSKDIKDINLIVYQFETLKELFDFIEKCVNSSKFQYFYTINKTNKKEK